MKPELLAPAGTLEKLKFAAIYGADAVYFGTTFGSLRAFAGNLSLEEADEGLKYLHERGKKGYVTLNIYPFSDEYGKITEIAGALDEMGVDAFIVADIGVLVHLKSLGVKADIHISTQANTTSAQAAIAYGKLGAKRVNLARELSCEQIKEIQGIIGGRVETEVFIHGAVCFSYSGRCAMSDYMTGFRANRGECKHPCRWKYSVVEEQRPGQYIPVFEDGRGAYLFNPKELALFEYVPELSEAGVSSFKIEGRMKSIHYVAAVTSFYRQVIDGKKFGKEEGLELLQRVPNRGYSAGFMKGSIGGEDYKTGDNLTTFAARFVGDVLEEKRDGMAVLLVRNKIHAGETLEVLEPSGRISQVTMSQPLISDKGERLDFANNSQFLLLDNALSAYSLLRRTN